MVNTYQIDEVGVKIVAEKMKEEEQRHLKAMAKLREEFFSVVISPI